jgi:uncharacterized MAPEG superfamily protein
MSPELKYLALTTVFTGLLWIPYVLDTILVRGVMDAVGYPDNPKPLHAWAQRLKKAHYNAVENLVVFAALVLIANAMGLHLIAIVSSAMVYFWARVVHAVCYMLGIPLLRTLAFVTGFGCQMCIAWHILS